MNLFKKKDKYRVFAVAASVIVSRVITNNPKYSAPLKMICELVLGDGVMDGVLNIVVAHNRSMFDKDPALLKDFKSILAIMGLEGHDVIDEARVKMVASEICTLLI
jgi:hypothetical protein